MNPLLLWLYILHMCYCFNLLLYIYYFLHDCYIMILFNLAIKIINADLNAVIHQYNFISKCI